MERKNSDQAAHRAATERQAQADAASKDAEQANKAGDSEADEPTKDEKEAARLVKQDAEIAALRTRLAEAEQKRAGGVVIVAICRESNGETGRYEIDFKGHVRAN